jgi:hypothetical protein
MPSSASRNVVTRHSCRRLGGFLVSLRDTRQECASEHAGLNLTSWPRRNAGFQPNSIRKYG